MMPDKPESLLLDADGISRNVLITGHVKHPMVLCLSSLRQLPSQILEDFGVSCRFDSKQAALRRLRVTRLDSLVLDAQPIMERDDDFKKLIVIAESLEGYRALFSWMELFHSPVGEQVYVAFDSADAPFLPHQGQFALVSGADTFTGPRHVRNLARITVQKVW